MPKPCDVPPHRFSSDISIDHAIATALKEKHKRKGLSDDECNLLHWHLKNTEYSMSANIRDISMKFWDSDDKHAFEGDHVLLKQGFSSIVEQVLEKCKAHGDKFQLLTNFKVGKVEYARNTTSHPYPGAGMDKKVINLSDTCCVTSADGKTSQNFDFIVCTLPLGVLKNSSTADRCKPSHAPASSKMPSLSDKVLFEPPLPQSKRDAIDNVGFGLLNKVYLQFPGPAFWRKTGHRESFQGTPFLATGQNIFGNASGYNPHYYMFLDVGRSVGSDCAEGEPPPILLTLISGLEAVVSEQTSERDLVNNIMSTLRNLFSGTSVPDPVAIKRTKWGSDEFSQGSYSFLPPGANEEDYHILQCPVNANGESFLLEPGSEVMRLFWAGEHTTSFYPSMAHGAYLSGVRAAKEVLSNLTTLSGTIVDEKGTDHPIPLTIFRKRYPQVPLRCSLWHLPGAQKKEGPLLAFKRGSRQALVHNNCAIYSPEVGLTAQGSWSNVTKAINRGKQIQCTMCSKNGGTIGCIQESCLRTFHFCCFQETGWKFERDGKSFICDMHRIDQSSRNWCISVRFFQMKNLGKPISCILCGTVGDNLKLGELVGFQLRNRQILDHKNCIEYTSVVHTIVDSEDNDSFQNVFEAVHHAGQCSSCQKHGATIKCSNTDCFCLFHFTCAEESGWNFLRYGRSFICTQHRDPLMQNSASFGIDLKHPEKRKAGKIQHNLFCGIANTMVADTPHRKSRSREYTASNAPDTSHDSDDLGEDWDKYKSSHMDSLSLDDEESIDEDTLTLRFTENPHNINEDINKQFSARERIQASRHSKIAPWNLPLCVDKDTFVGITILRVDKSATQLCLYGLEPGDIILSMGGVNIGSENITNIIQVAALMREPIKLQMEVLRKKS